MTLQDAFEAWISECMRMHKTSTWHSYECHGRWLVRELGGMAVGAVGAREARALRDRMQDDGTAAATIRQRLTVLKCIILFAASEGETTKPTDWRLRVNETGEPEVEAMTAGDHCRLFAAILDDIAAGRWRMLPALISMTTGLRIGEVCGLKWGDLNLANRNPTLTVRRQAHTVYHEGRKITVEEPKTRNACRTVPLPPQVRDALKAFGGKKVEKGNYVIGNGAAPVSERGIRENYRRFVYRLPVKKIKFHGLRHTYATMLVATGRDVTAVAKMMGHASVATTLDLYVHPSAEYKRKTMQKAFRKIAALEFRAPGTTRTTPRKPKQELQ